MSESKKPMTIRESVLARVPELEGLAESGRRDQTLVAYLAVELRSTLHRYDEAERRARNALLNAGRQVKEQQGYLDAGYSPLDTWLVQAAQSYATEAATMKATAEHALEQAFILQKLIAEQTAEVAETAARMGIQVTPVGEAKLAFPRERQPEQEA